MSPRFEGEEGENDSRRGERKTSATDDGRRVAVIIVITPTFADLVGAFHTGDAAHPACVPLGAAGCVFFNSRSASWHLAITIVAQRETIGVEQDIYLLTGSQYFPLVWARTEKS